MRSRRLCAALLGAALCQPAWSQDASLERLTHCFDQTPFHAEMREHGTTLGSTRLVHTMRGSEELAVTDGYKLEFGTALSTRPVGSLLLEQVPADRLEANKRAVRGELHMIAQSSAQVQRSARKADGLEVLALDRTYVGKNDIVSRHTVFHDASGVMATLTMLGLDRYKPAFHSDDEYFRYRMALLSRLGACMLNKVPIAWTPDGPGPAPAPTGEDN